jgi:DNA adenine methylase
MTLLTIDGEPPLGIGGLAFRDDQGEIFEHDNPRYRSPSTRIGVLALEGGKYLSHPPGFRVDGRQHVSREIALRAAIAAMVRKARKCMRAREGEGAHWSEGYAGRVIDWALSLKPAKQGMVQGATEQGATVIGHPGDDTLGNAETVSEAGVTDDTGSALACALNQTLDQKTYAAIDAGAAISDPIVRDLVEAHEKRRQFPASHTFAMTTDVADGRIISVATCKCGQVFKFGSNDFLRMNAACEAHWRRFDHDKMVDGRGEPIVPGDAARIAGSKTRKRRKSSDGGGEAPATAERPAGTGDRLAGHESGTPNGAQYRSVTPAADQPCDHPAPEAGKRVRKDAGTAPGPSEAKSNIADDSAHPQSPSLRSEPASVTPSPEAGSTSQEAAPIGAGVDVPDDWSPLLKAAMGMAWQEAPADKAIVLVPDEVERPALRWHGGKWMLAPWIIPYFPAHRIYVESFGGAASVLLRKPRAYAEVYNDLDISVVTLFRVLREPAAADRLMGLLRETPFARDEFALAAEEEGLDAIELCRRLIVRSFMGFGSDAHARPTGFRANSNRSGTTPAHDWVNYADAIPAFTERLRGVIIENRDACEVMKHHDGEDVLHYVDPPYLAETRAWKKSGRGKGNYRHELDDEGHQRLLSVIRDLSGYVVLSGYPSETYDAALPEWRRIERPALADGARPRTEVLWLNPRCARALDDQQPALFDLAAFDAANTPPIDAQVTAIDP